MLPRHAHCVLSPSLQQTQPTVKLFISLGLVESGILPAAPANTFHLILHSPATDFLRRLLFGDFLSLYLWSTPWRVVRLLPLRGFPPRPHPSKRVEQQQQKPITWYFNVALPLWCALAIATNDSIRIYCR